MRVELKGVHSATKRLAGGRKVTYYYAWKGGPRVLSEPGTDAFVAEVLSHRTARPEPDSGTIAALIADFKASGEFNALSSDSKDEYRTYLDLIGQRFGDAPLGVFEKRQTRKRIKAWRDTMKDTPRKADYALQTMIRLLYYGVDQGDLTNNVAARIKRIYSADRSDIIWEADELARLCARQHKAFCAAVDIACMTGLRRADLVRITWSADKGSHLEWTTQKTGAPVLIPILPQLRAVLDSLPRTAVTILTNSKGRPWKPSGLDTAIQRARDKAGIKGKTLHDMRGTAVTFLCLGGLSDEEVGEIVGWDPKDVARIRRRYVNGERIMRATVERLANKNFKPAHKPHQRKGG